MAHDLGGVGAEDVVILPLVLIALAVRRLFRATLSILIRILDYAFPILLQLARFPLFTVRIIGDGATALLIGIVRCLPVSGQAYAEWRAFVTRNWAWLRQKISYRAFEEFVHHAFESGMAWVFRKCRALTPGMALLVLAGAVLWLPISFAVATGMHAILIAKAATLPAWMQLLHPLATVVAKSKLLVLPVYPAAWPRAKEHPLMQAMSRWYRYLAQVRFVQKTRYRYRQAECVAAGAADRTRRELSIRFGPLSKALLAGLDSSATLLRKAAHAAATRTIEGLCRIPLIGSIVRSYALHYGGAKKHGAESFSDKASRFFDRWSIKFSAEYYEAKDKEEGAGRIHT